MSTLNSPLDGPEDNWHENYFTAPVPRSKQTRGSYILITIGTCFIMGGLAFPIIHFLIAHPWAVAVLVGCLFFIAGLFLLVWEHGILPLLPPVVVDVLMHRSMYSLLMDLHELSMLRSKDQILDLLHSVRPGVRHCFQLIMICIWNVENEEIVREILKAMDPSFRQKVFSPGILNWVPATPRRIFVGQAGAKVLAAQAQAGDVHRDSKRLQRQDSHEIKHITKEVVERCRERRQRSVERNAGRSAPGSARGSNGEDECPNPSADSCTTISVRSTIVRYYTERLRRYVLSFRVVRGAVHLYELSGQVTRATKATSGKVTSACYAKGHEVTTAIWSRVYATGQSLRNGIQNGVDKEA